MSNSQFLLIDTQSVQIQYLNICMINPSFQDKPIQLVHVTPQGKYQIHPEAEQFLKQVPKPLSVISVAGLYRTGKSYLLNRILLNRNNGFGVGPTINPCTKGLWCWGTPLKGMTEDGQKINILIIDSQGIGALDEDQNHDIKIFTLAILSSSIFIYNSVGSIDENALQNLSLVVNLTKSIQLNAYSQSDQDPEELAKYFPTFFWVVRDFALQLISSQGETITPKEYLERALAPQKGFSDDVEEKNRIRRLLTTYFKQRQCCTLVRPLVNQQKLQHLYDCSFDDLRPQFVEQALNLRKKVLNNAKPKMLKGQHLDGTMYVSMLNSYITAINNGSIPNIQNAWTYMCIEKCTKLQQQCYNFFSQQIASLKQNFPCSIDQFENAIEEIQAQCIRLFQAEQIGEQSKDYLSELKTKIKNKVSTVRLQNQKQSIEVLKKYIIKNFSVIEKKMKLNEYTNFQQFLKSVNSFYNYLLENGPNLPKREIVYHDFLKKVTSQGAQIFLKQANQNLQSLRSISQQKQKFLKQQNELLKTKLGDQLEKSKQALQNAYLEKAQAQKQLKQTEHILQQLKISSVSQMNKMQAGYENKLKVMDIKLGQLSIYLEQLKQKKNSLQSMYTIQKKQRQKQRALTQLKISQFTQQLKMLKVKDKNQQMQIIQINSEYSTKIRQNSADYDRKISELNNQIKVFKDKLNETQQAKENLEKRLQALQKNSSLMTRKYQEQLKSQIQRFDAYKAQFQNQKLIRLQSLQVQNNQLKSSIQLLKICKTQNEKSIKQWIQKMKNLSCQYEKQLAIANQKMEFLVHQQNESRQNYNKNIAYYQSLLKNKNEVEQEQIAKTHKDKIREIQDNFTLKIHQLQNQLTNIKEKYNNQLSNNAKLQQQHKFQAEMQAKKYQSQITAKNIIVQTLQEQRKRLYVQHAKEIESLQDEFRTKQANLLSKIRDLQGELEAVFEKASQEQSQFSNRSQQSLRQLKNYYQLEKQKLQQKIIMEKQKYEKKIEKLRDEHESQLEEERKTSEQEYQNLRDQYINETTIMKGTIDHLQHQNDTLAKSVDTLQKRCQEQKERLDKKQSEFNNKLQAIIKNASLDKQSIQNKLFEANELRSQVEKQLISVNHQKEQLTKQFKDVSSKYDSKVEQIFYLNKNIERISNENRVKFNQLNNEYMNERLNYQKKIALCQQEKQFYAKKLEESQKEHNKSSASWDDKSKKMKAEHAQEIKQIENKKNIEYNILESKYDKLKKTAKDNEQLITRALNDLQKQLAIEQQKYSNISERYKQLQEKKSIDGDQLYEQLAATKQELSKVKKQMSEDLYKLKKQYSELQNDRNQLQSLYERDKILMENKSTFLEEIKQKNKKEYLQKIRNLQTTLQTIQKNRMTDKNYYESLSNQNINKLQKKYATTIQENHQNWSKKEKEYESTQKRLQNQLRSMTEKMALDNQTKMDIIKTNERKIKELQQSEKRALAELQKYKSSKQTLNIQNVSSLEKEREVMKQKIQQREEKYKNLEKAKQQLYYDFEKQKAKWNLQKENYSMKNEELKDVISKNQRDIEKLQRENEKLKAQKKCGKMSIGYSRYSFQKANSTKYSIEDNLNSISMSMSKQISNPLGEISFFNNQ